MLAGNIPGKTGTVSQKIAMVLQDGDYLTAGIWSAIVVLLAVIIVAAINLVQAGRSKHMKRWQVNKKRCDQVKEECR